MKLLIYLIWAIPALVVLGLGVVSDSIGSGQKTWTVCPIGCDFSKIQEAINAASWGDTIQVRAGTYLENLSITKSLRLTSESQERVIVKGAEAGQPVILIEGDSELQVTLEGITVAEAKGVRDDGIRVQGKARVKLQNVSVISNRLSGLAVMGSAQATVENSTLSGNGWGIVVRGSAQVSLIHVDLSFNLWGLFVFDSAQLSVSYSHIARNEYSGFLVGGSTQVAISNSLINNNGVGGLVAEGSAHVSLTNSEVSGNGSDGLWIGNFAQLQVRQSTIRRNGTQWTECSKVIWQCNGIEIRDEAQVTIIDSSIIDNTDWGVAAVLKKCGYAFDSFTGQIVFEGANTITGNNRAGNHAGEVCLP